MVIQINICSIEWQKMLKEMSDAEPLVPRPVLAMRVILKSLYLDDSTTFQELIGG